MVYIPTANVAVYGDLHTHGWHVPEAAMIMWRTYGYSTSLEGASKWMCQMLSNACDNDYDNNNGIYLFTGVYKGIKGSHICAETNCCSPYFWNTI